MNLLQKFFSNPNQAAVAPSLEERIQQVLDEYRPTLYMDGGDVELLQVDAEGIAHVKMLGACIDCPISLLTMKLGIQRLLKENFTEINGVNAITDIDISALYNRQAPTKAIELETMK
ncbi:MAG: NifU family protein [Caldilineaceae bacterium]|nr:NifU family protein [Caldilineaceae bacterium]